MYKAHSSLAVAALLLSVAFLAPNRANAGPADDQYAIAAGHYGQRRWREAADEFADYLKQFPTHEKADSARFFQAEAFVQLGDYANARSGFAEFLKRHPIHRLTRQALFRSGESAYFSGHSEEAARDLETFRKEYPRDELNAYGLAYLGEIRLAAGDARAALEVFQDALTRFANGPLADECRFGVARAFEEQRDYTAADRLYKSLAANRESPLADNAQLQRGMMALHRELYSEAIETLRAFDADLTESELRTHARYWLGRSQMAREDWKGTAETFRRLAADDPKHELAPAAAFAAGEALRKGGIPADALDQYDRVLSDWSKSEWADDALQAKVQMALEAGINLPIDKLATEFDRRYAESPLRPAVRLALGRWHLGREEYSASVGPLEDYLKASPDSADAAKCRAQLAAALAGSKQFDAAAEAIDELQSLHPNEPLLLPTTLHAAELALAAKEHALARRLFERLSQKGHPPEFVAKGLAGLARIQSQGEGAARSVETLDRLIKEHPESAQAPEAALARAKELEKLGEKQEALAAYRMLLEKYPKAKETPAALLGAARLLDEFGQDEKAAKLLERLAKDHSDVRFLDAALYQYAWVLVDLAKDAEADGVFGRLHKAHRGSRYWADATFRLAERAAEAKDYTRAGKLADELLASKCDGDLLAHALYLQGQIAATEKRWKDVEEPLARILEEFPNNDTALAAEYWIAEAHFRLGELERADGEFKRLAAKTDGRDEPWLAMIPLRQAQILGHRKEWTEAYDLAQTVAKRYPNFRQQYEVDYLLGRCLGSRGEFSEARAAYERTIRSPEGGRTETAAMAQWMIGESYFHQKQYEEALRAYHRVERLFAFPRWQAAALLQAGKCREAQGDWKQAAQLYAQVLKDHPKTDFTDEASKRLRAAQDRAAGMTKEGN